MFTKKKLVDSLMMMMMLLLLLWQGEVLRVKDILGRSSSSTVQYRPRHSFVVRTAEPDRYTNIPKIVPITFLDKVQIEKEINKY